MAYYNLTFETFRSLVREHTDLFTISGALEAISKHIGVKREQQLFLFLHIDEFQIIDKWGQDTGKTTFFKDTLRRLESFMHSSATSKFIQTFLSGTAPQAVVKVQEPTKVSFRFIDRPLLSFRPMLDIAEHYADEEGAEKFDCGAYKWMLCRQFLQLLEDTGGLPHALQYLFEQCFGEWEQFVAYYEAFRNNLLIDLGCNTVKLSEVYPGAYGTSTTLGLEVKLQRLSVCQSQERFPRAKLTEKSAGETISWEKGEAVIVNGAGASWGDSFVVRRTINNKLLILHQVKYDYQSEEYSTKDLSKEHQKNLDTSAKAINDGFQDLTSYRHITVLFTTQPFSEKTQIQDDCLVVSESNFKDYFGTVFALHANFALLRQNQNFMEASRMGNRIPREATAKKIVLQRPYSSLADFYEKFPQGKRKVEEVKHQHSGKKSKPNLDFFPFEPMDQD
ncbi:hypothetical protein BGZ65_002758 [Modicella reniformis]|uniref:Uncharacterized protein n=1 Tax=Modicella reniformis TaxID=1440133 RepID=A0A9P6ILI0_9FUNG|nr:hypothetical protein BGZ65_002758 [Modicella reniformis]